jgi:hypothetical protein
MTDTPRVSAYPERARRWTPQTEDDFRAFDLYDDDTICRIAAVLPGFVEGVDHYVLAGFLRAWASQHLAIRRGANPDTAADVSKTYRTAVAAARELETAFAKLPVAEKGRMATMRSVGAGSSDDWSKNLTFVMSAPRDWPRSLSRRRRITCGRFGRSRRRSRRSVVVGGSLAGVAAESSYNKLFENCVTSTAS